MPRLTKEQTAEVDALADKLYDERNPKMFQRINVSKQKCIDDAKRILFPDNGK